LPDVGVVVIYAVDTPFNCFSNGFHNQSCYQFDAGNFLLTLSHLADIAFPGYNRSLLAVNTLKVRIMCGSVITHLLNYFDAPTVSHS
jgi:hypothetical protein